MTVKKLYMTVQFSHVPQGSGNLSVNGKEDRLGSLNFRLPVALPLAKPASRRFGSFVGEWLEL
ncbi:hypothetical protein, partial [Deinococcus wulumuqiensis]|uniref:hypothetical protein n=1 Tax=Deinococcus wulumuqiensis TaxID=980427 RepID=UPI00178C701E